MSKDDTGLRRIARQIERERKATRKRAPMPHWQSAALFLLIVALAGAVAVWWTTTR